MDEAVNTTSVGGYQKPKNWKDLSVEEKLERLREQIKSAQHSAGRANSRTYAAERLIHNHQHNPATGETMLPSRNVGSLDGPIGELSAISRKDEAEGNCYF